MRTLVTALLGICAALPCIAAADAQSVDLPSTRLVSTEWLQAHLDEPGIRVVDVREKIQDYWQSHVRGAVYLSPDAIRSSDHGVPGMLTPVPALVAILGQMGVAPETTVVIYAEESDFKPAYLLWALDYIRHERAAIVDGGFGKWTAEGRPVTQDYPRIQPASYKVPSTLASDVRVRLDEVRKVVEVGGAVLLDVRPSELYTGEGGSWKRKGHLKGAIHFFWGDTLKDDGTWKDERELRKMYADIGVTPDKRVITSCGQGQMSAHTYFTLRYLLGFPMVANYDGSFNEWSNIDELPVNRGPNP